MHQIKNRFLVFICALFVSSFFFTSPAFAGNPPDSGQSSLSTSGQAPADGQTTITITITLKDNSGNTLSGDTVSIADSSNSSAVISPSSTTLNSSGQATFTITSTNAETDNISVTDTSTNTTLDNLGQVTFTAIGTPTPTPGSCNDGAPGSTPQLTSAVADGDTQITLTWADATDPVSYYLVAYGLTSGQYIYGNPNVGGQGVTSYTVSNLARGTTYYFAVKAVNGCNPGSFSNEVSATTTGGVIAAPVTSTDTSTDVTDVPPTDTPTPSPEAQPTVTPIPVQTSAAGISKTQMLIYILILIVVVGGGGNFIYWKYRKGKESPIKYIEQHQPQESLKPEEPEEPEEKNS